MAETTIRAKNLRSIIQKMKDLHSHNVTLKIVKGVLTASISGTDNKGNNTKEIITVHQEER